MVSIQHRLLSLYLLLLKRKQSTAKNPIALRRKLINDVARRFKLPTTLQTERISAHGVACEWLTLDQPKPRVLMYLHGGAYVAGSLQSHRHLVCALSDACQADALVVDYRLAPEHPFPAAIDDAMSAYLWLIKRHDPERVILAGDSAGGGLAVALISKLHEDKVRLPGAVVLLAPWVDLTGTSPTIQSVGRKDVILSAQMLASSAKMYSHTYPLDQPFISPGLVDLPYFPPTLIQVGTKDLLLHDSRLLANKLRASGTTLTFAEWRGCMHVWHFFTDFLPESKRAIKEIGAFIDRVLK